MILRVSAAWMGDFPPAGRLGYAGRWQGGSAFSGARQRKATKPAKRIPGSAKTSQLGNICAAVVTVSVRGSPATLPDSVYCRERGERPADQARPRPPAERPAWPSRGGANGCLKPKFLHRPGTQSFAVGSFAGDGILARSGTVAIKMPGRCKARPGLDHLSANGKTSMHRRQFTGARNKLDLNNRVQVRIVRKRLKVSDEQLADLVRTAGNSMSAIRKEARLKQLTLP